MKDFIIPRTFQLQWINHPVLKIKVQYVGEDILFEDITTDLESFAIAEELDYDESMIHWVDSIPCIITRSRDLRLPVEY